MKNADLRDPLTDSCRRSTEFSSYKLQGPRKPWGTIHLDLERDASM